jgi:hypothetical protein
MIFHTVLQSILFITYKVINKVVYIYMSITLRFMYTWLFVTYFVGLSVVTIGNRH